MIKNRTWLTGTKDCVGGSARPIAYRFSSSLVDEFESHVKLRKNNNFLGGHDIMDVMSSKVCYFFGEI